MAEQSAQVFNRINRLDNRLANQIAAGEVVERPASVVKELLENSIDAGANRIEVDIERGGTRLIRVTDNGCGVVKEDLGLALSRHATSKISTGKDLAAIDSLGFRGEALASIGSVSRLCFTSRTIDSDLAWQAIAEGRDMQVNIQPASASIGTRIEVRDLFYNTPARQKFLRTEKTEFAHIEEIFKRHALANLETTFILKHNHKVVKRVPAGGNQKNYLKRIESICGKAFAEQAIPFICEHDAIKITGWLGGINFHRSESDIQYVFINGRPVKDKMLNHAIRQSYQGLLPPGRMPTFVIFLSIDPAKIDVNVHPTKHEVRFDEQRMVHDLLVKSVSDALGEVLPVKMMSDKFENDVPAIQAGSGLENKSSEDFHYSMSAPRRNRAMGVGYSQVNYQTSHQISDRTNDDLNSAQADKVIGISQFYQKLRLDDDFWMVLADGSAYIVDLKQCLLDSFKGLIDNHITEVFVSNIGLENRSKPLLFPQKIQLDTAILEELETVNLLQNLGFVFEPDGIEGILLQQVPGWLTGIDNQFIFDHLCEWIQLFSERDFVAVYRSLQPLPSQMIDYLLSQNQYSLTNALSSKQITSDLAKSLFSKKKPQ